MPCCLKLGLIKIVFVIWPNEITSHFSLTFYKVYFSWHKLLLETSKQTLFYKKACDLYYKTITIVIMMIISDAPNCGVITYDRN